MADMQDEKKSEKLEGERIWRMGMYVDSRGVLTESSSDQVCRYGTVVAVEICLGESMHG